MKRRHFLIGMIAGMLGILVIAVTLSSLGVFDVAMPTLVPTLTASPELVAAQPTFTPQLTVTVVVVASPIPTPTPSPMLTPSSTPTLTTYVVQNGDVLQNIALIQGVSVEAIKMANGLTDDLIYVGQTIIIPSNTDQAIISSTPIPTDGQIIHIVTSNETLELIASHYGVNVQALKLANGLTSDIIHIGQELVIPKNGTALAVPEGALAQEWQPSILEGNLEAAYPQTVERPRYTLHYPPNSLPEREIDHILAMVDAAIVQIEDPLGIHLEGHFDVYVAGGLFGSPNLALRGRSFSSLRRLFFLWDGTGSPAERQYIITHEMTHTFTWNSIGRPASVMLHEGVAVFTGMPNLEAAGYIKLEDFCAAYYQAGRLPLPSAGAPFMGHIYDLDNYFSAGCFVKYLVKTHGADKFASLYTTLNYTGIYGVTLVELQNEWLATLNARELPAGLEPETLIHYVDATAKGYEQLFAGFGGTSSQLKAYRALDQARIAMLAGQFDKVEVYLTEFNALLGVQ